MTPRDDGATLEARAPAFALASLLAAYPRDDFGPRLASLLHEGSLVAAGLAPEVTAPLAALQGGPELLDELRGEYVGLFDRAQPHNPLLESEYGRLRALGKGNELADIAGFYRAFGVDVDGNLGGEPPDHLAVELEFYAFLLLKQAHLDAAGDAEGVAIVDDARRKFLDLHLGRLAPAALERARGHERYAPLLTLIADLVAEECRAVGLQPERLEPDLSVPPEPEAMECGGTHLPVLQ